MKQSWSLFAFVGFLMGSSAFAAETIKVGIALRFEEAAHEGFINSFNNGFELAKKQFMKTHPATKIEFVKYSHKSDPASIHAMTKKVIKDEVRFVIGGESSDESLVMMQDFEKAKVLLITPTSTDPVVTQGKQFAFRTCFSDDRVAKALAKYVFNSLKDSKTPIKLALVHHTDNAYTDFLSKTFYSEFSLLNKAGKLALVKQDYKGDHFSFTEMVKTFADQKVTHVALLDTRMSFLHFIEAAQKQKFTPTYFGSDGWGTPQNVLESLGKQNALKDFAGVLNSYWYQESDRPEVKAFTAEYKSQFSRAPDGWSAIAFDSAKMLFESILKSGSFDTLAVAKALQATEFKGMMTAPVIKFEKDHSPVKTLYLYEISANRAEFKTAIE